MNLGYIIMKNERMQENSSKRKCEISFHYYAEQNKYRRVQKYNTLLVERRNMLLQPFRNRLLNKLLRFSHHIYYCNKERRANDFIK